MVVGIAPLAAYETNGQVNGVRLTLRREVTVAQVEQRTPLAAMDEQLEKMRSEGRLKEDEAKMMKSMLSGFMAPLLAMGGGAPSPSLAATVEMTEEEYLEAGRPGYGDRVQLEVGFAPNTGTVRTATNGSSP